MGFQPSGGVKEFIKLEDTPASFAGQTGKLPVVKSSEDALEFLDVLAISLLNTDLHIIDDFTNWTEIVVGAGSATFKQLTQACVRTGDVAGSEAILYDSLFLIQLGSSLVDNMDWSKKLNVIWAAIMSASGAGAKHSWLRYSSDIAAGALADNGIGFRWKRDGYTLYAESHDGVAIESTIISTGFALADKLHLYQIKHTPGVKVEFYLDNVLKATHTTRIPAGYFGGEALSLGAENGGVNEESEMSVNRIIFSKEWN